MCGGHSLSHPHAQKLRMSGSSGPESGPAGGPLSRAETSSIPSEAPSNGRRVVSRH